MSFFKFFSQDKIDRTAISNLGKIYDIVSGFKGLSEKKISLVAGFAGLLGKVAYADMEISLVETARMRKLLAEKMNLGENDIEAIFNLINDHTVEILSIEDYVYVRLINEVANKDEKTNLLKLLFSLAACDDSVSSLEDSTLWLIAKGLKMTHHEFIEIRKNFNEYLEVLK